MAQPVVVLYRSGKGPFKKNELVLCPEKLQAEAAKKIGDGLILLVTPEQFDLISEWRDKGK